MAKQESELAKELAKLRFENEALREKLQSKRYRAMDTVVDTFYKVIRRGKTPADFDIYYDSAVLKNRKPVARRKVDAGRIDIINVNFYNWDGEIMFLGGAERYVYDLACLLKKMGYRPRILQGANKDFEKRYGGIDVVGVAMPEPAVNTMSRIFSGLCKDAEAVISSPLELACELDIDAPIVGINHGINFDHPQATFQNTSGAAYVFYQMALENVTTCICVDTNFINWVRTRDYRLSHKLVYIPNYYDPKIFKNVERKKSRKVRFVYPRRIYTARGADITVAAFDKILEKYADRAELTLVGQIDNEKIGEKVKYLMDKYPKNVFHTTYQPDEMHKAYENADVVLIPTRYSEGTSLSCIEGMASGAVVVATDVGGLPNLIIDDYNGLLISPTTEDLQAAVEKLILSSKTRSELAKNAVAVAKASFTKGTWEKRWKTELENLLNFAD